jgi:hypothetical protein
MERKLITIETHMWRAEQTDRRFGEYGNEMMSLTTSAPITTEYRPMVGGKRLRPKTKRRARLNHQQVREKRADRRLPRIRHARGRRRRISQASALPPHDSPSRMSSPNAVDYTGDGFGDIVGPDRRGQRVERGDSEMSTRTKSSRE